MVSSLKRIPVGKRSAIKYLVFFKDRGDFGEVKFPLPSFPSPCGSTSSSLPEAGLYTWSDLHATCILPPSLQDPDSSKNCRNLISKSGRQHSVVTPISLPVRSSDHQLQVYGHDLKESDLTWQTKCVDVPVCSIYYMSGEPLSFRFDGLEALQYHSQGY